MSGRFRFRCRFCARQYGRESTLREHLVEHEQPERVPVGRRSDVLRVLQRREP